MQYVTQVEIAAPPDRVWSVLSDIGRWPAWTPTVAAVEVLEGSGSSLQEGGRVRLTQPGVRPATYTVTEVDEGRHFRWEARRPGLRQYADHEVEPTGQQRSRVTLGFGIDGPVGWLVSPVAGSTVRRMVDSEAAALRDRVENGPPAQQR